MVGNGIIGWLTFVNDNSGCWRIISISAHVSPTPRLPLHAPNIEFKLAHTVLGGKRARNEQRDNKYRERT